MKLHISDVLVRAAERGHSPEEIAPCLSEDLGGGWFDVDVDHPSYPRHAREGYTPPAGLGDIVAKWLGAMGITKERVAAAVGGPCGCEERQEALNELGAKYLGIGAPKKP